MGNQRHPVSDHAVLRYLERVAALDVEAIRQRIEASTKTALAGGASGIVVNGISYKFRRGRVTTIFVSQNHVRDLNWPADRSKTNEAK